MLELLGRYSRWQKTMVQRTDIFKEETGSIPEVIRLGKSFFLLYVQRKSFRSLEQALKEDLGRKLLHKHRQ